MKKIRPFLIIGILTLMAYVTFGPMFSVLKVDLAVQAASAAFSAIFVLLATNVLLNQQEEREDARNEARQIFEKSSRFDQNNFEQAKLLENNKIEKERKVFDNQIEIYKKSIVELNAIFENKKVSYREFERLKALAFELTLVAAPDALLKFYELFHMVSSDFEKQISADLEFASDDLSNFEDKFIHSTSDIDRLKAQFVNACRESLNLPGANVADVINIAIGRLVEQSSNIEEHYAKVSKARGEIEDGVEGWLERSPFRSKRFEGDVHNVQNFLNRFAEVNPEISIKITESLVSIRSVAALSDKKRKNVVLYIRRQGEVAGSATLKFNCPVSPSDGDFEKFRTVIEQSGFLRGAQSDAFKGDFKGDFEVPVDCDNAAMSRLRAIVLFALQRIHA